MALDVPQDSKNSNNAQNNTRSWRKLWLTNSYFVLFHDVVMVFTDKINVLWIGLKIIQP